MGKFVKSKVIKPVPKGENKARTDRKVSSEHTLENEEIECFAGDGLVITVHAPAGDFDDDEMSEGSTPDDQISSFEDDATLDVTTEDESLSHNNLDKTGKATQNNPDCETEDEILAWYGNNPNFQNYIQRMLPRSIEGGRSTEEQHNNQMRDDGNYRRKASEEGPPQRKRPRTETVSRNLDTNEVVQGMDFTTPVKTKINRNAGIDRNNDKIKSPSDTMLYAPAFLFPESKKKRQRHIPYK